MRKTQIDYDDAQGKAQGVLEQASGDPSLAHHWQANPTDVARLLGIPATEVVQFTIEPNQYCVAVPGIGLKVCVPVITLG